MSDLRRRVEGLERVRKGARPLQITVEWEPQLTAQDIDELLLWHTRGCPEDELPAYYREHERRVPGVTYLDWDDAKAPLEDAKMHAEWYAKRPDLEHAPQAVDDFWKGEN